MSTRDHHRPLPEPGNPVEVFLIFLRLGLTSFGGPIAHLSYFREEFVNKQKWISEGQFAQLIAICQFLPGPASSQLGFSVGLIRAGWKGALAAFIAFTAPSALLLIVFAAFLPYLSGPIGDSAIQGLKIVALAVVAHGVMGMLKSLCPDNQRIIIATLGAIAVLVFGSAITQLAVVAVGALAGIVFCRQIQPQPDLSLDVSHKAGYGLIALLVFALLLLVLPLLAAQYHGYLTIIDGFYRAGSLVFGGGHVVLPLLEETVATPGRVSPDTFLAGYGAAQAVPGPMFSFAAYLGYFYSDNLGGMTGALIALGSIFLPGFLLVAGILPFWRKLSNKAGFAQAIAGVNAAVVGILGAALYDPIFVTAVQGPVDLSIGLVAFVLLAVFRLSALSLVAWCVAARVFAGFW